MTFDIKRDFEEPLTKALKKQERAAALRRLKEQIYSVDDLLVPLKECLEYLKGLDDLNEFDMARVPKELMDVMEKNSAAVWKRGVVLKVSTKLGVVMMPREADEFLERHARDRLSIFSEKDLGALINVDVESGLLV